MSLMPFISGDLPFQNRNWWIFGTGLKHEIQCYQLWGFLWFFGLWCLISLAWNMVPTCKMYIRRRW